MRYWERCWYCKKLVRGGIQGIRGHLRGCPYIRESRTYQFKNKTITLDGTPKTYRFFDIIFSKLHSNDDQVFVDLLTQYIQSFGSLSRMELWVEENPVPEPTTPGGEYARV